MGTPKDGISKMTEQRARACSLSIHPSLLGMDREAIASSTLEDDLVDIC